MQNTTEHEKYWTPLIKHLQLASTKATANILDVASLFPQVAAQLIRDCTWGNSQQTRLFVAYYT
jgi:hypothetical protein